MLKYIKEHMATVDGVEIFPIISMIIFMSFFVILLAYIYKTDKNVLDEVQQYPLDNDESYE